MRPAVQLAMIAALFTWNTGCIFGGEGQCIGTGGQVDVCKERFTPAECDEWDDLRVNGSSWRFTRSSCKSNGFTYECRAHDWLRPADADVCT